MQEKKYLKLKEEKLRGQEHWIEGSEEVGLENESKKRNKEGNQEKKRKMEDYGHTNESRTRTKARKMTFTEVDDEQLW